MIDRSKKPRKRVEMSKDAFSIYLTLAYLVGWTMPSLYTWMVLNWS